jgi:hypothetical protein
MIANILAKDISCDVTFENIEKFVPTVHLEKSCDFINDSYGKQRFIKSHFPFYSSYPRMIYVYRDPRDVAISYFFYLQKYGHFTGEFMTFLKTKWSHTNILGSWQNHVLRAIEYKKRNPENILLLQYEEMLTDPSYALKKIEDFCGFSLSKSEHLEVLKKTTFNKLSQLEDKSGSESPLHPPSINKNIKFFRSGKSKQWINFFSEEELDFFYKTTGKSLEILGFK